MRAINTACAIAYEIAFLLFVPVALLVPLHAASTRHLTVVQTVDETHAVIAGDTSGLAPGMTLSIYRHNSTWKTPIGEARVQSVYQGEASIEVDPEALSWPLGRHGRVERGTDGRLYAGIGSRLGIDGSTSLSLFRDRKHVGEARILASDPERSLLELEHELKDPTSLVASEYLFATQAVFLANDWINYFAISVLGFALAGYVLVYLRTRKSPFLTLGAALASFPFQSAPVFWTANLVAGVPFTWFMTRMPLYLFDHIATSVPLLAPPPIVDPPALIDAVLPYAYAVVGLIYYGFLFFTGKSPIIAFWRLISYDVPTEFKPLTLRRGLVLWAQHLLIVYVFATTLIGFLQGNIEAAREIGWPPADYRAAMELCTLILSSSTVLACLIAYGYSVISILWGTCIRNLDFTFTGWLTNGFCYPVFGAVIAQMAPSFVGADPLITEGALYAVIPALSLFFDVLYSLSIFNLGTKFDLMADKGLCSSGFFSVVRHPNYTLEAAMFLLADISGLTGGVELLSLLLSSFFLYWIRSEREDNFMAWSNPDYADYQKRTPYKFIPGIY